MYFLQNQQHQNKELF